MPGQNRAESSIGLDKSEIIREEFKPFVSEGFVSLEGCSSQVPIKILRDTGATQSLLLKGVLSLSVSTSTGESVIAQGVEAGCVNVHLHNGQFSVRLSYWFCCGGYQAHFTHKRGIFVIGK